MSLDSVITLVYLVIGLGVDRAWGGHIYYNKKGSEIYGRDPEFFHLDVAFSGIIAGLFWPLFLVWPVLELVFNSLPKYGAEKAHKREQKTKALQARKDKLEQLERELELDD